MSKGLIAKATADIHVPVKELWDALINPEIIKQYMFGTEVVSNWQQGSRITWKGQWEGKPYEDKGVIVQIKPPSLLQFTHFSPLTGKPDADENYHTLTYELTDRGNHTFVSLTQDNNDSEKEKDHAQNMWESLLASLKKVLEGR